MKTLSARNRALTGAFLLLAGPLSAYSQTGASNAPVDSNSSPWGIAASSSSSRVYPEWFPKMSAIGITWCRSFPGWSSFEPEQGTWKWDAGDAILKSAIENHLQLSGMLTYTPKWAVSPGATGTPFPMGHLDDWSVYVANVVAHYKDRIHYWEVWNEPNGAFKGRYGKDKWDTTTDYATVVADAYAAAKKSDPNAQVGISVASFDAAYIDQAILAQAKMGKPESFDYICIHPYETIGDLSEADGEIPYLWMAKTLRDELKVDAPDRANAEIWITEIGRRIGNAKESNESDSVQASDAAKTLVKAYIMAIAQGIQHICWFEAEDPHGEPPGYGLLKIDGTPRPAYDAMKAMTASLGAAPKYLGWLALGDGGKGYGFVFQGASGAVLVAWMPKGETDKTITFTGDIQAIDSVTETHVPLKAGQPLPLTDSPALITHLPADVVAQAQANLAKNFPWGGDYSTAASADVKLGAPNDNHGVIQVERWWTTPYKFDDGSTGALVSPPGKRDSQNIKFIVHPSYANLTTHEYYIRVTARRIASGKGPAGTCGMNLIYEMADSTGGWPMNSAEWFGLSSDTSHWQTYTWHVTDAAFAKMWGYDLAFVIGRSDPFVIGKVEVSTKPFGP